MQAYEKWKDLVKLWTCIKSASSQKSGSSAGEIGACGGAPNRLPRLQLPDQNTHACPAWARCTRSSCCALHVFLLPFPTKAFVVAFLSFFFFLSFFLSFFPSRILSSSPLLLSSPLSLRAPFLRSLSNSPLLVREVLLESPQTASSSWRIRAARTNTNRSGQES